MTPPETPNCKPDAPGVIRCTDWLYVGKKVGHRDTSDRWRMRGEVIDALPFGEFIVKWDEIKRPERMLRYDLDACCGGRSFWFDKKNPLAVFVDKRREIWESNLPGRSPWVIDPDVLCDFTALPFPDETFYLVVFDPPHMTTLGHNAHMAKKYGRLIGDWHDELAEGFRECLRVLKPNGTLVFKWNTTDVPLNEVLALAPIPPLFGHTTGRQAKTIWAAFLKPNCD